VETQTQGVAVQPTSNPNAKVIKRYQNRKLYDTQQSCYVTLDDIAKMIRANEEVVVIDNKSKKDITSSTLTQIIFENEKKNKSMIGLETLREIIQTGAGSISSFLEKVGVRPVGTAGASALGGTSGGASADPVRAALESAARSFEDIERTLGNGASGGRDAGLQERLSQLAAKLNTLETKIRQYELDN
jgi:polyhydroxyalkanoate synthesis repressor PhaR